MPSQVTIVSVFPKDITWGESKSGNIYKPLRAPRDGQRYSSVTVIDEQQKHDTGYNQHVIVTNPAQSVAEDLVREWASYGVFVAKGDVPTEAELKAAEKTQKDQYLLLIEEADKDWSRFHDHRKIHENAKLAARKMNVKRDWAIDISDMVPCPVCKFPTPPDAIKCSSPSCGAILDMEKARKFGLVSSELYDFATGKAKVEAKAEKRASA